MLDYWIPIDGFTFICTSFMRSLDDKRIDQNNAAYEKFLNKYNDESSEKFKKKAKEIRDEVYERLNVLKGLLKKIELGGDTYSMAFRILHNKAFKKMDLEG
jgi:DNA-binding transcriptional regulator GbsR (MarR family)